MDPIKPTEIPAVDPAPVAGTGAEAQPTAEPLHDPAKPESKDKPKAKYTKRQTLKYNIDRLQKEFEGAALEDGDEPAPSPATPAPGSVQPSIDDLLKGITDETERTMTAEALKNTQLSGNALVDFKLARIEANGVRNRQISEEVTRRTQGASRPTASGAPTIVEQPFVPTAEESAFMQKPFNMSEKDIIAARMAQEKTQR